MQRNFLEAVNNIILLYIFLSRSFFPVETCMEQQKVIYFLRHADLDVWKSKRMAVQRFQHQLMVANIVALCTSVSYQTSRLPKLRRFLKFCLHSFHSSHIFLFRVDWSLNVNLWSSQLGYLIPNGYSMAKMLGLQDAIEWKDYQNIFIILLLALVI